MSRLVIDLPDKQHQKIKALATLQGKTMKELITEKILTDIDTSQEQLAHQDLEALLAFRLLGNNRRYPREKMSLIVKELINNPHKEN